MDNILITYPILLVLLLGSLNWFATAVGSTVVFVNNKWLNNFGYENILAISAGIMLSASFWSLLLPAIEMAEEYNQLSGVTCSIGFLLGIFFLFVISKYTEKSAKKENTLLITAIAIHNIPEGFIVGVLVSGLAASSSSLELFSVITLSLAIGLQNIPEGLAVSLPLSNNGMSKLKSFNCGQLTGLIEPISAIIGYLFISNFPILLPYSLAFAAGSMIYVVVNELVPEATSNNNSKAIIWFSFGFVIMMLLDTILG